MYIDNIRLRDYRNYTSLDVSFNKKLNIIIGQNAQGKTNKEGRFVWNGTVTWLHENSGRAFCYPIQSYYDVK